MFKLASDILRSHDFLEARAKAQKYVKHEFQDYAYRLASDLGDLQHKYIYMRLAKNVDRTMLEQAAAFAFGYFDEKNKGRIFMWKLKQLQEYKRNKAKVKNFDQSFIFAEMADLYDKLAPSLMAKWKREFNETALPALTVLVKLVSEHVPQPKRGKINAWLPSARAGLDAEFLHDLGWKVKGQELSLQLTKLAKVTLSKKKISLSRSIDFQPEKDKLYDVIWVPQLWEFIAHEQETGFLQRFIDALKPKGVLAICLNCGDAGQTWKELKINEDTFFHFSKVNSLDYALSNTAVLPLEILHKAELPGGRVVIFLKKI